MSLTLVLSVGSDPLLLESRNLLLQFAGYTVVAASSVATAIRHFRDGDFDLVLLDHSLSTRDRERMTQCIRTAGSRIPVLSVCPGFDEGLTAENAMVMNDPPLFLTGVRKALLNSASARPSVFCMEFALPDQRRAHSNSETREIAGIHQRARRAVECPSESTY